MLIPVEIATNRAQRTTGAWSLSQILGACFVIYLTEAKPAPMMG